ncbi:hypothetical protein ACTA71_007821 [Dictyostelium dimigraforme]
MKLIIFIIIIVFNCAFAIEYSCPNKYNYSLTNGCHKGNLYFSSGFCLLNKGNGISEYGQFYGNSNINSPCPIGWASLSWGFQMISNKSLTWNTCKLKEDNSIQFYQVGNCGDSIEYNSTTLSFTNENHFLNIITCSTTTTTTITMINITSIKLKYMSSINCLNGTTNIFTWDYGNDVCPIGFYGNSCQYKDYCYLNICGNKECENLNNIGKGYNCFCKEGYRFNLNETECEIDTCYIKNYHKLDCGIAKCNITSNQLTDNGTNIVVFNCYCDFGFTLSFKKVGNDFVKYCQKNGECQNSTICGMASCINNGTDDNCVCLNQNTHLFISNNGTINCVDNIDSSKWKIPVSIMVSVIGFLFLGCISIKWNPCSSIGDDDKVFGNDICRNECGTAKCNYTNEEFYNCFCENGYKLSSNGKSCNFDQCFGTIVENVCGSANCNYSFFSDWSLDSNSNKEPLYLCYCDEGYILVYNTNNPYCLSINGSTTEKTMTTSTTIINNTKSNINWTIPIVIIVSIFILLLFGSIIIYFLKRFCRKPKRYHYQLIR